MVIYYVVVSKWVLSVNSGWYSGYSITLVHVKSRWQQLIPAWKVRDECIRLHVLFHVAAAGFIPRPSITADAVEGLVKLLRRMTSGRRWEAWHFWWTAVLLCISHASQRLPNVYLTSFYIGVLPGTLAVIEGLGAKLGLLNWSCVHYDTRRILTYTDSRLVVAIKCKFILLYTMYTLFWIHNNTISLMITMVEVICMHGGSRYQVHCTVSILVKAWQPNWQLDT